MHVSPEHLLTVATNPDVLFTKVEFNHIKECVQCFEQWAEFIREAKRAKETEQLKRQRFGN